MVRNTASKLKHVILPLFNTYETISAYIVLSSQVEERQCASWSECRRGATSAQAHDIPLEAENYIC